MKRVRSVYISVERTIECCALQQIGVEASTDVIVDESWRDSGQYTLKESITRLLAASSAKQSSIIILTPEERSLIPLVKKAGFKKLTTFPRTMEKGTLSLWFKKGKGHA